jgi:PASTA domain-containing protein
VAGCGASGATSAPTLTPRERSELDAAAAAARAERPSVGGGRVVVPRVAGKRFDAAVHVLREAGLRQGTQGFPGSLGNPTMAGDCIRVTNQSPAPGTKVPSHSEVEITSAACRLADPTARDYAEAARSG